MDTRVLDRPAQAGTQAGGPALKLVELELALGAQDIRVEGFEAAVRNACADCGVAFVFNLPVFGTDEAQRVAAAGWREGKAAEPEFAFVTLGADGSTITIDRRCDCLDHAADVARAWFDLMTV